MSENILLNYNSRYVIYKLTSPSNKIYIGQTINLKRRFAYYNRCYLKDKAPISMAVEKYGFINFKKDILFDIKSSDRAIVILNMMEKYFIKKFNCVEFGYNCRTGGKNSFHSEESIGRMRVAKSITSNETRKRMSDSASKRIYSIESKILRGKSKMKPVIQYSIDGKFIKEWDCAFNASSELNISAANIGRCCLGKKFRKTCGGFIWKFKKNTI